MLKRTKKYYAPQNENVVHKCDFPGCAEKGEYRAPKDRKLKDYYWFCLKHVQEYNSKWNYYGDGGAAGGFAGVPGRGVNGGHWYERYVRQ